MTKTKRIGFAVDIHIYKKLQELKKLAHGASDRQIVETLIDKEYNQKQKGL